MSRSFYWTHHIFICIFFDHNKCWCLGPEPCHLGSIYFLWGKQQAHWHSITLFWHNDSPPPPVTWTTHNTVHDESGMNQTAHTRGLQTESHGGKQWPTEERIVCTQNLGCDEQAGRHFSPLLQYYNSVSALASCRAMLHRSDATADLLLQQHDRGSS